MSGWGFGGLPASGNGGGSAQANTGPDLEAIETEQLGFQALAGERKLRLIPSPWPADSLPPTTASLLSVASGRGLLAAAGPDTLVIHSTDSIRTAFESGSNKVQDVEPKSKTSIPRVSHIAFSSDESCLVIAAEAGGGLAVYDASSLGNNPNPTPSFQLATNGVGVRHLLPNPGKDFAHIFAVVLTDGKLLMADLKGRTLVPGVSGGSVLREGVSCASWSKLGKQIVAGLADGSAVQLDPRGNQKEEVPRPPKLLEGRDPQEQGLPVTAIFWLENPDFFVIHTPINSSSDTSDGMPPSNDSVYHLVHRDKDTKACSYHRFVVDPCPAFMDQRIPAHHFVSRIRDWQPNLDDTLILSSTASADVGILTRSKIPLSQDLPAEQITHTYTTTSFTDTRRAALPTSIVDEMSDTSPIGMAIDLSSKQKVPKPIPNDETIDESSSPLPQLCLLNQEGLLCAWWYVYNEAVRDNKPAPGLVASGNTPAVSQQPQEQPRASPFAQSTSPAPAARPLGPALGQMSASGFGQPGTSSFGKPSQPVFGQPNTPAFGAPSSLNTRPPALGGAGNTSTGATAFGQPSFGAPSFGAPSQIGSANSGSAFGQIGGMGQSKQSVWGSPSTAPATPQAGGSFGKPSSVFGGNASTQSPFASFNKPSEGESKPGLSPFAGFAQNRPAASPFASFASPDNKPSAFATTEQNKPGMPNETSFGSTVTLSTNTGSFGSGATFGQPSPLRKPVESTEETMGEDDAPKVENKAPSTGLGALGGFKLGSTFKGDGSAKNDLPRPKDTNSSLFGLGFDKALGDAADSKPQSQPPIKEEMDDSKEPKLSDIPEAPVSPPEPSDPEPDAAPLPPDFVSSKPVKSVEQSPPASPQDDAPLPPDFISAKPKKDDVSDIPIAGSPPVDVGASTFSSIADVAQQQEGPPETEGDGAEWNEGGEEGDEGEAGDEDEEDDAEEGEHEEDGEVEEDDDDDDDDDEGEDDEEADQNEEDEEEEEHTPVIENPKKLSAFEARMTPASPKREPKQDDSTTPETAKKPSFTPAGFPKAPLTFAPPRTIEESPRSPSPIRGERAVTSPMRIGQSKSQTAAQSTNRISVPPAQQATPSAKHKSSLFPPPTPAPEPEDLEDAEDARIKAILEAPIKPTKDIPEFIAHQDYAGVSEKAGIAGQLEKVYRDVNGMIDTLGLNARALQAFVDGHSTLRKSGKRSEEDLEDENVWTLSEINDLQAVQRTVEDNLEEGRLDDVREKIDELLEEDKEMARVKAKTAELRKQLSQRTDAQQRAKQQHAALPPETAAQQSELRQSAQHVQKLLAQAEEQISLLRADLASASVMSAETNTIASVPSVEAVSNTILKMTAMIEKKSGDVDVLETLIRRLPNGLASLDLSGDYEGSLVSSMAGSKLSNGHASNTTPPPKGRARMPANGDSLGMSGMFGSRFQTPPRAGSPAAGRRSLMFEPLTSALGRSTASLTGSARKKMADVTPGEVHAWQEKTQRRRKVFAALKHAVEVKDAGE